MVVKVRNRVSKIFCVYIIVAREYPREICPTPCLSQSASRVGFTQSVGQSINQSINL